MTAMFARMKRDYPALLTLSRFKDRSSFFSTSFAGILPAIGDKIPTRSASVRIKPVTAAEAEMCKWSASFFNTSEVPRVIEILTFTFSNGFSSLFCLGFFVFITLIIAQAKIYSRHILAQK